MKKSALLLFVFLLSLTASQAQEIRISPVAGPTATFALLSKDAKDRFIDSDLAGSGIDMDVSHPPAVGLQVGALVDYAFNESFRLQSGLLYHLRGYTTRLKIAGVDEWGDPVRGKGKVKYAMSYLELPLWASFRIGENGLSLAVGPSFGFAIGGKGRYNITSGQDSENGSAKLSIGSDSSLDDVKPVDVSLHLSLEKALEIGGRPFGISLFAQPSLTPWNPSSKADKDYWSRYLTIGLRAAYSFQIR